MSNVWHQWFPKPILICLISLFQGKGSHTIDTLRGILLEREPNLGKDESQEIIDKVDEDGSGTIDFNGKFVTKTDCSISFLRDLAFM